MLKNCCLPVNYNNSNSQMCGEIICENLKDFIINCKLCRIKIFEFEDFIQHFKNIHLLGNQSASSFASPQGDEEIHERIIKFEIIENENYEISGENAYNQLDLDNIESSEESKYDGSSLENKEETEADEEQTKSILRKIKSKDLSCEICGKKYADSRRLHIHVKMVHLREKPYKCSKCNQEFAEDRFLKNHIERQHVGYECTECHKIFKRDRNLKIHMLIHLDKKEFICTSDNCGKAFASKRHLRNHQRYHTDAFMCEECGYKCYKRDSLIVHKRRHTGDKPFGCNVCDRRFGSKALLNEHMAAHESERRHVCDVCGKSFNRPKALYHHKHLHLDVKKFVCKICGQAYAQAAGLSAHTRKHRENATSSFTSFPPNNTNTLNALIDIK